MMKSTSRGTPPSRKAEAPSVIPDEYLTPRWSDDDLHRLLALSTLGVLVFGGAWLTWRIVWLLWPAGLCALGLQVSATMIAARAAVNSNDRRRASRAPRAPAPAEGILATLAKLVPPASEPGSSADEGEADVEAPVVLTLPITGNAPHDTALHRAFFRRVVDAEFVEYAPGTVWPDLSDLQGSLATRLRLFQRHPAAAPQLSREVSESERTPQSPWHHLAAIEAIDYRRGDTLARFAHRAFAPLAFLELHARLDLDSGERESLETELGRLYTVGYGRILTPPSVLSAVEPLRQRMGGSEAIGLADDARLAMRSTSNMREAEQLRGEFLARARALRDEVAWPTEVMSMVECLVDYWLVQRAAAADIEWAEELARLEGTSIGEALAKRDAGGSFHFADTLRLVFGHSGFVTEPTMAQPAMAHPAPAQAAQGQTAPAQPAVPTTAATVA